MSDLKLGVGIPTINRADLLVHNLQDLVVNLPDIDKLYIVDNGNQIFDVPPIFQNKLWLHRSDHNLGVSGSWNLMLRTAFLEDGLDYLLLLNDDIVLGKTKEQVLTVINDNPTTGLIVGNHFWSVVLMHKNIIEQVGFFDENFFPAYYEDNDYHYRCKLAGVNSMCGHVGLDPIVKRNSATIQKDPSINNGFGRNGVYYRQKWGGSPAHEKFTIPFNGKQ